MVVEHTVTGDPTDLELARHGVDAVERLAGRSELAGRCAAAESDQVEKHVVLGELARLFGERGQSMDRLGDTQ